MSDTLDTEYVKIYDTVCLGCEKSLHILLHPTASCVYISDTLHPPMSRIVSETALYMYIYAYMHVYVYI